MINPYYFIHKVSQVADNNNLDSHQRKHLNSKINISPNYFGIEKKHISHVVKQLFTNYAGI